MKVTLFLVGKTSMDFVRQGIHEYTRRLKHYMNFKIQIIPDLKHTGSFSESKRTEKEGEKILNLLDANDYIVLLDERGEMFSSSAFADFLQQRFMDSYRNLVFVIGGAYGFSDKVYKRSNRMISLSRMTFSHQITRIIFLEQLYRALTILKGDPYHHS